MPNSYYFKTKKKETVRVKKLNVDTGKRELVTMEKTVWVYVGIVSPFKEDFLIMSTDKHAECIYHTQKELPIVRARLHNKGLRYRIYNANTDECINTVVVDDMVVEIP